MHRGYIKHYRAVREHWVHDNANYYMAWFDIIELVNHEEKKLLIDGELIICKRGEALYSLDSWVKLLGKWWTKQKIRTFFKLLQIDKMICYSGMRKTTRLSVVNYDKYNTSQHTDNTQITHSQHTDNTQITSTKELISIKKELKEKKLLLTSEEANEIYSHYPRKEGKKDGIKKLMKLKPSEATKELIVEKVKQYAKSVGGKDKTYIALFSTWCNKERWQDDYITESKQEDIKWNPVI